MWDVFRLRGVAERVPRSLGQGVMATDGTAAGGGRRSKSNTQVALETLTNLILTNELPAGSNHLENELAERLGMSRTPVREATLILQAQGLLEVVPRRGVKILPVSAEDMREIYLILTALEGLAVELAAGRELEPGELNAAEQAISDMDAALKKDDRDAWAAADETFHNELVRLSGNNRIAAITSMYNNQVRRARAVTLYLRPSPTKSNDDHRDVLRAIQRGDADAAKRIHTEHRIAAGEMLSSLLTRFGLHQV